MGSWSVLLQPIVNMGVPIKNQVQTVFTLITLITLITLAGTAVGGRGRKKLRR